jgi:uncharacterized membrane protein YgaE (UPF0421/DUF939 family)
MSILKSVLEEELKRNLRNQMEYRKMLNKLPKGSIYISDRNGKQYMYRKNREGKKIINKYVCALSNSNKAKMERQKSEEYNQISNNLKIVEKEELKLRKALKAYE